MQKQKIILDTDIGCDCDDAGAMALLHALASTGSAEILAITHATSSQFGAPLIELINSYYHRPEIPIGVLKDEDFMADKRYDTYAQKTVQKYGKGAMKIRADYESATRIIRKVLASQENESVKLVAIGQLRNIRYLLESNPDDLSPYCGKELISQKVSELVIMGGYFPKPGQEIWLGGKIMNAEFNIVNDIESAKIVADEFPKPIMYSGYEIGCEIKTGKVLFEKGKKDNPIRYIYEIYNEEHVRESWDQTAVLYAVRGLNDFWNSSSPGTIHIDNEGVTHFCPHPNKNHRYLIEGKKPFDIQKEINDLMSKE